jgi:hypothetical protein
MENRWRKDQDSRTEGERFIDNLDEDDENVFNGVEVTLTKEILDDLEEDVKNDNLPPTNGFFFGNDSYENEAETQKKEDLKFIKKSRKLLDKGYSVFYNSSW